VSYDDKKFNESNFYLRIVAAMKQN